MNNAIRKIKEISSESGAGSKLRDDISEPELGQFFEGILLRARQAYEEKKVPLLASLFATAPFTNTPLENLHQSLTLTEQLTYRQICLLAIIGRNQFAVQNSLRDRAGEDELAMADEVYQGVYEDVFSLMKMGLVQQLSASGDAVAYILAPEAMIPARL